MVPWPILPLKPPSSPDSLGRAELVNVGWAGSGACVLALSGRDWRCSVLPVTVKEEAAAQIQRVSVVRMTPGRVSV